MAIPDPYEHADDEQKTAETPLNRPPEHEPAPERARVYNDPEVGEGQAKVVPLRDHTPQDTESDRTSRIAGVRKAAEVWGSEAKETAEAALDGSVWRARPPSLRDIHTRAHRAEWAGENSALRKAGQWFGHVSLVITAVGYALLWLARRPSRLAVATALAFLIVFFVF